MEGVIHIVQEGESLCGLALWYYQDSSKWRDIYKDNKDRIDRNGGGIYPRQKLLIRNVSLEEQVDYEGDIE